MFQFNYKLDKIGMTLENQKWVISDLHMNSQYCIPIEHKYFNK